MLVEFIFPYFHKQNFPLTLVCYPKFFLFSSIISGICILHVDYSFQWKRDHDLLILNDIVDIENFYTPCQPVCVGTHYHFTRSFVFRQIIKECDGKPNYFRDGTVFFTLFFLLSVLSFHTIEVNSNLTTHRFYYDIIIILLWTVCFLYIHLHAMTYLFTHHLLPVY